MKIVVIGGTGLIGKVVVQQLQAKGHEVIAASPSQGINALTGEGLEQALRGAHTLVDVSNSPNWEDQAVLDFFTHSTINLIKASKAAGVQHYVALSIVGLERVPEAGYFRAKLAQENLIKNGGVPYTLIRATQFAEFVGGIAESVAKEGKLGLPDADLQPIAARDVSKEVTRAVLEKPANGTIEIAGPQVGPIADFVRQLFAAKGDTRPITTDPQARYFGALLSKGALLPAGEARLGPTEFGAWLRCN
jgi:uncharacterized protein YbjT (DUF2867 family)